MRAREFSDRSRRADRDYSQIVRRGFQGAFFLLNIWMGAEFYYWVRQFEPGGAAARDSWERTVRFLRQHLGPSTEEVNKAKAALKDGV